MSSPTFDPSNPIPTSSSKPSLSPVFNPDRPVPILPTSAHFVSESDLTNGIYGASNKQTGVVGHSETFIGVAGDGPSMGVFGNSENGDGVVGTGKRGVVGESETFQGVFGKSRDNAGVVGESDRLHGVFGICHNPHGAGTFGTNDRGGMGVSGESINGIGVHGKGGSLAALFEGNVEITGDIRLSNADCAEHFEIMGADSIAPGTVMVLGFEGSLLPSHSPYDKRVAGVVSGAGGYQPGIVLDKRDSSLSRLPIALLGKVFCKVDAQYGSIEIGDLLTTSATEGHAMKACEPTKAFGTVIGKALRPLKEGQGLIPILVSLQ